MHIIMNFGKAIIILVFIITCLKPTVCANILNVYGTLLTITGMMSGIYGKNVFNE